MPDSTNKPLRIAALISGGGRTLLNIADCIDKGELNAEVVCIIGSRGGIAGIERAEKRGFDVHVVPRKDFEDAATFSTAVFDVIRAARADIVCLAGFLSLLVLPDEFTNRVLNVHPALLPAFGGKGMYGERVHQAVIEGGCKVSGCTIHYCDATYDTGPIIVQRTCPVLEDDTPCTLAARVFEQECIAFPHALELIAEGRVKVVGRRTVIDKPRSHEAT